MHTASKKSEQKDREEIEKENASSGRLQEVKKNRKSLSFRPKRWSRSLTVGGRLPEVPTVRC